MAINVIKSVPEYQNKTPSEIFDYLSEITVIPNLHGWTPKEILDGGHLTKEEMRLFVGTMQADSLTWLGLQWFATNKEGLEFGSNERQTFIDDLSVAGNWESQIVGITDRIKALGRLSQTNWQQLGGSGDIPSVDTIEKALAIAQCRDDMAAMLQPIQAKSTALNAWLDSLNTNEMTVEQVQAYCEALLASEDGNP